ncbi:NlpC/P60 family protein [Clostridium putrefaciens]|uniref:NlpC/P60 family protein n=1 Tax=Clostridium putrefaciens TaxID=99675 RepID=A0A381J4L5_9CLOT|nr:SH3 domain-containing protein [Clostridium putrefaciens]SUY45835.1 NlpC/P60 family protein [Clostridium putrefaciens]
MNKKKISMFIISASIVSSINFTDNPVYAIEDQNNTSNVKSSVEIKASKGEVINVSTNLNIRESAGTNSSTLGHLVKGQQFNIKGKTGHWYNIDFDGIIGYVHKDFVKELYDDTSTTSVKKSNIGSSFKGEVINVSTNLRIRSSSSTSSPIVGYLRSGDRFNIKEKSGQWYLIEVNGKTGYIHKDYVKEINNDVPSKPPTDVAKNTTSSKGEVINVNTNLNIRESAGMNYSVVGQLINRQQFNIKGKVGDWYSVDVGGKSGYIHKDYVKELNSNPPTKPVENPTKTPNDTAYSSGVVVNVNSNLRIRSSASTSGSVIGSLNNGQKFNIKDKISHWYLIESNGKVGYVHKDYVKELGDNTTNPPIEVPSGDKPSKGSVINVITNLRMRKEPNTNSSVISYLISDQRFNINGKSGDWYFIECDNKVGYIHKDYTNVLGSEVPDINPPTPPTPSIPDEVLKDIGVGIIHNVSTNLRLRSKPSTSDDSQVIAYILPGKTCNIIGTSGQWYKIIYDGKTGYVGKDYVKMAYDSNSKDPVDYENIYNIVISAMASQLGSPYIWGGSGEFLTTDTLNSLILRFPNQAKRGMYNIPIKYINSGYRSFDCSSLMQWGFRQAGVNIGRTTWDQINNGVEVSKANVKPGDLLFFSDLNHVGMYIGDGKWIESPNSRNFLRIVDVPWYKVSRIRRVI